MQRQELLIAPLVPKPVKYAPVPLDTYTHLCVYLKTLPLHPVSHHSTSEHCLLKPSDSHQLTSHLHRH